MATAPTSASVSSSPNSHDPGSPPLAPAARSATYPATLQSLKLGRIRSVELYREGKLSLGKAAELAGMRGKWEMLMLLSERGVPLDYSAEDAKDDLWTLREVLSSVTQVSKPPRR